MSTTTEILSVFLLSLLMNLYDYEGLSYMKNELHFGDNLEVMQDMPSQSYHLTYLDPPFKSGRNYNIFLDDSKAQKKAFEDTWHWDKKAIEIRDTISNYNGRYPELEPIMERLDNCLIGFDYVLKGNSYGDSMRAYLAFMGIRLAEIWRLLKPSGSVYLHCDSTASHYLKGIMDNIFGHQNFRNEIIWLRIRGAGKTTQHKAISYGRSTDHILFYAYPNSKFDINSDLVPLSEDYLKKFKYKDKKGRYARRNPYRPPGLGERPNLCYEYKGFYPPNPSGWTVALDTLKRLDAEGELEFANGKVYRKKRLKEGMPANNLWLDIPPALGNERLNYPTQKPVKLLERIIKASSDPGQIVFDPFCGCGTTIDAAHGLNRQWVGIDLTVLALEPMERRLRERHGLEPRTHYTIEGYPTTYEDAKLLAERNAHDFANWAVTRLGLRPTKDVGDGGLDGTGKMLLYENRMVAEKRQKKVPIIAEVKSGNPTIGQVREFRTVMRDQNATIGVFITLGRVTSSMRQEVEKEGFIELNAKRYPRLQFWQIDDIYFKTGQIPVELPYQIDTRPKAERHYGERYETLF